LRAGLRAAAGNPGGAGVSVEDPLRGLRRGEAAGLRWLDVDLDECVIMISQQRITFGHITTVGPPKTAASRRTIALDKTTVRVLRLHRQLQMQEAAKAGDLWGETATCSPPRTASPSTRTS
jgi:integrase